MTPRISGIELMGILASKPADQPALPPYRAIALSRVIIITNVALKKPPYQHSMIAAANAALRSTSRIRQLVSFIAIGNSVSNARLPLQNVIGSRARSAGHGDSFDKFRRRYR
ncbi:MAG TPA: hypothetical protein VJS42_09125 [Steroidobacteraceae bacterium]|nr:hypothetical protein [Steroidobacteraceae bacterium]